MHSRAIAPASAQIRSILATFPRVCPEASRPSDWKHVRTQPRSLLWHQPTVFVQE